MIRIGDIVRLARGWTPMCIIGIAPNGDLQGMYFNYSDPNYHSGVKKNCYLHPFDYEDYTRPRSGWVLWDGEPIKTKVESPMRRYKTISNPSISGVFLSTTSNGDIVIEMDNGNIRVFPASEMEQEIPYTFTAQVLAGSSNRSMIYSLPNGVTVNRNDILMTDTGTMLLVTKADSKHDYAQAGEFKGQRAMMQNLY